MSHPAPAPRRAAPKKGGGEREGCYRAERDPTQVTVVFSEPVEQTGTETAASYALDNGISVTAASLGADLKTVALTVSTLTEGVTYTLTVNNVADLSGNVIAANSTAAFTFTSFQPVQVNFQKASTATPAGYLGDGGAVFADRGNGQSYGWLTDHTAFARERGMNPDPLLDTLLQFDAGGAWEIAVPNREYTVTVSVGDAFSQTMTPKMLYILSL